MIITIGPSGSGKTTWVDAICEQNSDYVKIERDEIRRGLAHDLDIEPYSQNWKKAHEKHVTNIQKQMVANTYKDGTIPVISDTNLRQDTRDMFCKIAEQFNDEVTFVHFFTSREELHQRNNVREDSVPTDVIDNHYRRHVELTPFNPDVEYASATWYLGSPAIDWEPRIPIKKATNGPEAFIFDIDGTLALRKDRSPFDWERVDEDDVNEPVLQALLGLEEIGKNIILVSGRDEACRGLTERWLKGCGIPYDALYMREHGDNMKDNVVKHDIYVNYVYLYYDVQGIFDDRNQTVDMWRAMGLPCLQVAEGNF